jgi:hypothetical protein
MYAGGPRNGRRRDGPDFGDGIFDWLAAVDHNAVPVSVADDQERKAADGQEGEVPEAPWRLYEPVIKWLKR